MLLNIRMEYQINCQISIIQQQNQFHLPSIIYYFFKIQKMYISENQYTNMLNKIKQLTQLNQTYHSDNTKLGQQIIRQRNLMKKIAYQNSKRNTTQQDDTPNINQEKWMKQEFVRQMKKIEENLLRQIQKKNQQQKKFIQTHIQKSQSLDNASHRSAYSKQARPYPQRLLGFLKQIKEKDYEGKRLSSKQIIKLAYEQKILEKSEKLLHDEVMENNEQQSRKKRKRVPLSAEKSDKNHSNEKQYETPLKPKYDEPTPKKTKTREKEKKKDDEKDKKKKAKQHNQDKPEKPKKPKSKPDKPKNKPDKPKKNPDKPNSDEKQKKKRQQILNLLPGGLNDLGIK